MENTEKIKTLTPLEASKIIPKNAEWIRAGLRQGILPFGYAVQSKNGRYNYIIFEKKFLEWVEELS